MEKREGGQPRGQSPVGDQHAAGHERGNHRFPDELREEHLEKLDSVRSRSRQMGGSSTVRRMKNAHGGRRSNEEEHPPSERAEDERRNRGGEQRSDGPAGLVEAMALPRCSAGHVSATSTDPHDHSPPCRVRPACARRSAAERMRSGQTCGGEGVDQDAERHRADAADAIGDRAEGDAADGAGDQGDRVRPPIVALERPNSFWMGGWRR